MKIDPSQHVFLIVGVTALPQHEFDMGVERL